MTRRARGASIERNGGLGGPPIFDAVSSSPPSGYETGDFAGAGTFFCLNCGGHLSPEESEALPECPHCGASTFRRDSIFEERQEHPTTTELGLPAESHPAWLLEARRRLPRPGYYLVLREEDEVVSVFAVERGWTRIGRSVAADLRLDDPSVSRRHALVVAEPGQGLRVLDDRSLNGVFVNGEAVEWGPLEDGDELTIGCHTIYALKR